MKTETMLTTDAAIPSEPVSARPSHRTGAEWRRWVEGVLTGNATPTDYLPVTEKVREAVDRDLAFARERLGAEPATETAVRQLRYCLLSYHFGGQNIAYIADDQGIVVLAIGLDQIGELVRSVPYELASPVAFDAPDLWM